MRLLAVVLALAVTASTQAMAFDPLPSGTQSKCGRGKGNSKSECQG